LKMGNRIPPDQRKREIFLHQQNGTHCLPINKHLHHPRVTLTSNISLPLVHSEHSHKGIRKYYCLETIRGHATGSYIIRTYFLQSLPPSVEKENDFVRNGYSDWPVFATRRRCVATFTTLSARRDTKFVLFLSPIILRDTTRLEGN